MLQGHRQWIPTTWQPCFACGLIYSLIPMVNQKGRFPDSIYSTAIVVNGINFTAVLHWWSSLFYLNSYVWIFGIISLLCLCYSIFLKYRITEYLIRPFMLFTALWL